jgi:hypothetical protein
MPHVWGRGMPRSVSHPDGFLQERVGEGLGQFDEGARLRHIDPTIVRRREGRRAPDRIWMLLPKYLSSEAPCPTVYRLFLSTSPLVIMKDRYSLKQSRCLLCNTPS